MQYDGNSQGGRRGRRIDKTPLNQPTQYNSHLTILKVSGTLIAAPSPPQKKKLPPSSLACAEPTNLLICTKWKMDNKSWMVTAGGDGEVVRGRSRRSCQSHRRSTNRLLPSFGSRRLRRSVINERRRLTHRPNIVVLHSPERDTQ